MRWAWAPAEIFPWGESQHFSYLLLIVDEATQIDVHKKMSNVTATIAYSAFLVRKLYTEQAFGLVSMDILRLS